MSNHPARIIAMIPVPRLVYNLSGEAMMNQQDDQIKDPIIELYKKDVDVSLIRENLRLSIEERFVKLMEMQRLADELRNAGREYEKK
jgi:hypothetical protein